MKEIKVVEELIKEETEIWVEFISTAQHRPLSENEKKGEEKTQIIIHALKSLIAKAKKYEELEKELQGCKGYSEKLLKELHNKIAKLSRLEGEGVRG